jgi:heptosyltransferase-2
MTPLKILIWLPSPLGDAIMATPALRALRNHFKDECIVWYGSSTVRETLFPTSFADAWIEKPSNCLRSIHTFKTFNFTSCVLLKNSFSSALTVWLARIPRRIGYARDGRAFLLTDRIESNRDENGRFMPTPAVDYYLRIAQTLGADITDRTVELSFAKPDTEHLQEKLPALFKHPGPLVVLVPGGAFGPSKCWPSQRFAQIADALIEKYNVQVIISIAPNEAERQIATAIQQQAKHPLISLGDSPLPLGALKALIAHAALVITNDTGPRHIAIALNKNVVSLFGPNNPQWTQTGHDKEIQIVGQGQCVPCDKPRCRLKRHVCMESITVEQVFEAASRFLERQPRK